MATDIRLTTPIALLMLTMIAGCEQDDGRMARMASDMADRQAEQNREMAQLNREVAEGTRRLVESDARSREELLAAQRDLQTQQHQIGLARDQLESERREWARQRRNESVYVPLLTTLGITLLALLPLGLCWQLLHSLNGSQEQQIGELLIEDLVADEPMLLPRRPDSTSPPAIELQNETVTNNDSEEDSPQF